MNHPTVARDSAAWIFFVWASFVISAALMALGILYAPINVWIRGYLAMGLFFTIGSSFTLAKTVRDNHEAQRMINRVVDAKTEQILTEYEFRKPV
jgi:hypothetical protein